VGHVRVRFGKAGMVRLGVVRQGVVGPGRSLLGKASAWLGGSDSRLGRHGVSRCGPSGFGKSRHRFPRLGEAGMAGRGPVWQVPVVQGLARFGGAGKARLGGAGNGTVRQARSVVVWCGEPRRGLTRYDWRGMAGMARPGAVGYGEADLGRRGKDVMAGRVRARLGGARQAS
jgi:hypothetical protein